MQIDLIEKYLTANNRFTLIKYILSFLFKELFMDKETKRLKRSKGNRTFAFSNKVFMRSIVITNMFIILASSVFTVSALNRDFEVVDGEDVSSVKVINTNTDKILKRANVSIGPDDKILRDDQESRLTVKRAFEVTIIADDKAQILQFNDGTVNYALYEAGIDLGNNDKVNFELTDALVPGMEIKVTRFCDIILNLNSFETHIQVPKGTVKESLDYLGITLNNDDTVNYDLNSQVQDGMRLVVTRINYNERTDTEIIPYATVTIKTDKLNKGEKKVETAGVNGERIVLVREKIVNGLLEETVEVSEISKTEPIDEVILEGTHEETIVTSSNNTKSNTQSSSESSEVAVSGKPISYRSVLKGSCTAYTSSAGALTSTGKVAQVGYVAVNPNIIPYGTELYICSEDGSFVYGYAIAADTGGALMDGSALVDLYYNTESECISFGRRTLCVYILD